MNLTKDDYKTASVPEVLTLERNVRVVEHGEITAVAKKAGEQVKVSGQDKLDLLQMDAAKRTPSSRDDKKSKQ